MQLKFGRIAARDARQKFSFAKGAIGARGGIGGQASCNQIAKTNRKQ